MTRLVHSAADRLLATLLPKTTAGACVPEHGSTVYQTCYCSSDNRVYMRKGTVTCNGPISWGTCYRTGNIC